MDVSPSDRISVVAGVVAGVLAWMGGYAVTYVIVAPDVRESPLQRFIEAFAGEPATYEMTGWVFFNAHLVDTVYRDLPLIGSQTTSFIGGEDGFTPLLYLVPAGSLLIAGIVLARYREADDPSRGALAGVLALPGYLLASVVGVFLFEVTLAGATGGPDPLPAVFLGGIVYPVLFAGGGGAIGGLLEARGS